VSESRPGETIATRPPDASEIGELRRDRGGDVFAFKVSNGSATASCTAQDGTSRFTARWKWIAPPREWRVDNVVRLGGSASVRATGRDRAEVVNLNVVKAGPLDAVKVLTEPNPLLHGGDGAASATAQAGTSASVKGYAKLKLSNTTSETWALPVRLRVTAGISVEAHYHYTYVEGTGTTKPLVVAGRKTTSGHPPVKPVLPQPPTLPSAHPSVRPPVVATPPKLPEAPTLVRPPVVARHPSEREVREPEQPSTPPVKPVLPQPPTLPTVHPSVRPPVVATRPKLPEAPTLVRPPVETRRPSEKEVHEPEQPSTPPREKPPVRNALDARKALQMSVGTLREQSEYDMNHDGRVTARDATRILQDVVKQKTERVSQ